jgi:hypothetical protein
VPAYDELQGAVAEATAGIQAERVLELGVGTGQTSRRVLDLHPPWLSDMRQQLRALSLTKGALICIRSKPCRLRWQPSWSRLLYWARS